MPTAEVARIKRLVATDVETLEAAEIALRDQPLTLHPDALSEALSERAQIDLSATRLVVSVLWRLALVQRRLGLNTAAFVQGLGVALRDAPGDGWRAEDGEALAERTQVLERLLHADGPLASGAKAGALLFEQQLVLCNSRVVTDVRPVFDEAANLVQAFVPFHTLALTCHEGGETREFHIAMDLNDVAELREHLERAERKEEVLTRSLTEGGLSVIRTGGEPDAESTR